MSGASPQTGAAGETGVWARREPLWRRWAGARGRRRVPVTWRMGNLRCTRVTLKQLERPAREGGMPATADEILKANWAPQRGWEVV